MKKTNITIEVTEIRINGNCKKVKDITNNIDYNSVKDAAKANGVATSTMSVAINREYTCNGNRFIFVDKLHESSETLCSENAKANKRANRAEAQLKAMEEEMAEYRLWKAEREAEAKRLEAERKAKEDHEKAIAKAKAKIEMYTAECERREAKLQLAVGKLMAAEMELKALEEGVC